MESNWPVAGHGARRDSRRPCNGSGHLIFPGRSVAWAGGSLLHVGALGHGGDHLSFFANWGRAQQGSGGASAWELEICIAQRQSIPGNCGTAVVGEAASWGEGRFVFLCVARGLWPTRHAATLVLTALGKGMPATKHRSNLMESLDNTQSFALPNDPGGGLVQRPSGRGWMG